MKYNIKYTIGGSKLNPNATPFFPAGKIKTVFKPKTKIELQTAVIEWVKNKTSAISKYGDINNWNTSLITDMSMLFMNANGIFNDDISNWNVSAVTDMSLMFGGSITFNIDIGSWDVSAVTDMSYMFQDAKAFNQDIGSWNVSAVTNMGHMFQGAISFNQDISPWHVSAVKYMGSMFYEATAFNQGIRWDVSAVTDMTQMFYGAILFNKDIGSWDVSAVTDMSQMFEDATSFNQDIGLWIIGPNTEISNLFYNSGVTRQTFLPKPSTNPGQYGTGRGIYGFKIANYFNPPLPNPKTIKELETKRINEANWQRRKPLMMVLSEIKKSTRPSSNIAENTLRSIFVDPENGPARNLMEFIGGSNC